VSRFNDNLCMVPLDSDWEPFTVGQLLTKLSIRREAEDRQRAAIAEWLETNEPSWSLVATLEDSGLMPSEAERAAAHRHSAA
jgi:hypothetical protein